MSWHKGVCARYTACVCGEAVCTRGTQWTSEQWGLCGRGGRCVHSILPPPRAWYVCLYKTQTKHRERQVCVCMCDMKGPTKQRDKGKWHETEDKRWRLRVRVHLSKTELLFKLQPTCTSGMQCLLLPWKREKVREVFLFFFQERERGQFVYRSASTRCRVAGGNSAHNIDVRLYKAANQICPTLFCRCGTAENIIPAPVITHTSLCSLLWS